MNVTINSVRYLTLGQHRRQTIEKVLAQIGLDFEDTIYTLPQYGHLGGTDALLAVQQMCQTDFDTERSYAIVMSSGIGYSWGALMLWFRPTEKGKSA